MLKFRQSNQMYQLLSLLGQHKTKYFTLLIGTRLLTLTQTVLFAWLLKLVIDAVTGAGEGTNFLLLVMGITLLLFLLMVVEFYLNYVLIDRTNQITGQIRLNFISQLINLPLSYYDTQQSGDLISRLTNDISSVEEAFTRKFVNVSSVLLGGIVSASIIVGLDWRIGLFSISIGLLTGALNILYAPKFRRIAEQLQQTLGQVTSTFANLVAGIRTIKLFNLYKQQLGKFQNENGTIYSLFVQQGKYGGLLDGMNLFLGYLSSIGILAIGILFSIHGDISIGTVVAILFLQNGVTTTFLYTGNFIADLQQSLVSTKRVCEIVAIPRERHETVQEQEKENLEQEVGLALENITFRYDSSEPIVQNLDLTVRQGESAALVGQSGSGKSTIVKLLMGFYPIESGRIQILGKRLDTYQLHELREQIAYVPQEPVLFHTSIEENIRYGSIHASKEAIIAAAKKANAHPFIEQLPLGYKTQIHEHSSNLSGGQRQRIAIARAFLKDAPILLLDEATSALDTQAEQLVQQALEQLMVGRTTLMIAHRLTTVKKADLIFVLEQGQVVEQGTHQELMNKKGRYYEMNAER